MQLCGQGFVACTSEEHLIELYGRNHVKPKEAEVSLSVFICPLCSLLCPNVGLCFPKKGNVPTGVGVMWATNSCVFTLSC